MKVQIRGIDITTQMNKAAELAVRLKEALADLPVAWESRAAQKNLLTLCKNLNRLAKRLDILRN